MLLAACVLFLVIGFAQGYYFRDFANKLKYLESKLRRDTATTPTSSLLEPTLTPAQRVKREQEELLERLNPQ